MIVDEMTLRQRLTWLAHCWKAWSAQHHRETGDLLTPYIAEDATILDVGAHSGQFSKLFSRMAPKGQVLSFEPGSYARSILSLITRLHGLRNVEVHPYAVGSEPGTFQFNVPIKESGSLGFGLSFVGDPSGFHHPVVSEMVEIKRLDDALRAPDGTLRKVDFIKADIEGYELEMLKGASELLALHHPVVFIEVCNERLERAGGSNQEMCDLMEGLAYEALIAETGETIAFADLASRDGSFDVLFLPASGKV